MHGKYTIHEWLTSMVNVGKYTIHGWYGLGTKKIRHSWHSAIGSAKYQATDIHICNAGHWRATNIMRTQGKQTSMPSPNK